MKRLALAALAAGGMLMASATADDVDSARGKVLAGVDGALDAGPYAARWDSLERHKTPDWYLDGKFGIFIHWGLYSVPAFGSEWYPRNMYEQGSADFDHHVKTYGPQATFGYKDFIPMFRAENYRPGDWATLFREAGAKFIVPVAEHHDGFAMYDTALSNWSAAKMGPRRDLIGDLAKAVRKEGLVFGLSSHRAEHWWFFNGGRKFESDVQDPKYADFYGPAAPDGQRPDKAFLDDWLARCAELLDRYKPQLFWFDWWIEEPEFKPYLQRFGAYYYNRGAQWRRGVAINYKNAAFPSNTAVFDVERGQLAGIRPLFWQTDTSISKNSWGYVEKQDYKTAPDLIADLVDIVSKNGALLLNIGPRPDGTIPEPEQRILREMGAWLKVNGEAIYGTRPWLRFGEGPTQVESGSFRDTARAGFTPEDIRFTTKGGALYAITLAPPGDEVVVRSLRRSQGLATGEPASVTLLGSKSKLSWTMTSAGLAVRLPAARPKGQAVALKITGLEWPKGPPAVPLTDGVARLEARDATLHGAGVQLESRGGAENIGYWDNPDDWVSWKVRIPSRGVYSLNVEYAAAGGEVPLLVTLDGKPVEATLPQTAGWDDFQGAFLGHVATERGGVVELALKSRPGAPWKPLNLRHVNVEFPRD